MRIKWDNGNEALSLMPRKTQRLKTVIITIIIIKVADYVEK